MSSYTTAIDSTAACLAHAPKWESGIFQFDINVTFQNTGSLQVKESFTHNISFLLQVFLRNVIKIDWHASPFSKLGNRNFAKSVLRMVFKSLETFLNRFNFKVTGDFA